LIGEPVQAVARLESEYVTLVNELEVWVKDVPSHHPLTGVLLDARSIAQQRLKRQAFMEELKASWSRRQTPASPYQPHHFYLYLDIMGELPELTADFGHVTELVLGSRTQPLRGHGFFRSFSAVQFLTLEGIQLDSFPLEIYQMRDLVSLTLNDCSLRLSDATAEGLSRIEGLQLLSLNDNPLGLSPHVGFMKGMRDLYLHNTGLTEVPSGLFDLEYLSRADLTLNDIVDVPEDLFDVPVTRAVDFDFRGNPLSTESDRRISQYLNNAGLDLKVSIRWDGFPEVEESDDDFGGASTDSALGSDEENDEENDEP
jgi:Leucine-rich repeat (LRR) protein